MSKGWIVLTGGGSGIGLSTAKALSALQYSPILIGRSKDRLKLASSEVGGAPFFSCDVAISEQVTKVSQEISKLMLAQGIPLVGLVNNAGIIERQTFLETSEKAWEDMWQTNMMGAVRMTAQLLPHIRRAKGQIINISSTLGLRPIANTAAYSATKAAMVNWSKTLALEEARGGVRVNCICPGLIDTPIHSFHAQKTPADQELRKAMDPLQPLGRMGQPHDIAQMVVALFQSQWVTGSIFTVDGGISL
ncbi:MAG: SDR family oxidoreductase [Bdellovibrionales bacterium]|nr:SDR family oxidoreductase [Bdellovibrionales bacterium]